ncbi:hypothetical protein [Pontibacter sp. G13]|uniref:hypothetical protein n=1 Tax=Pontibacter sp. G13 TaxID=3074898 RepID=UPI00288C0F5E|nr:hypothetical protein [Pontibacter sp. G13]WNJ21369.1 hypothetical protein RJD25_12950 [Pontibacter sp. G13]
MKHVSTLFLLVALCATTFAQTANTPDPSNWDKPQFDQKRLRLNGIQSIHISSYQSNGHRTGRRISGVSMQLDERGQIVQKVEMGAVDTARIHEYAYNDHGKLRWEQTTDVQWNRTYQSGYRLNTDQQKYQVRSYEVLRNDERMLLATRQYIYDDQNRLSAIRFLEDRRVIRTNTFEYDEQGRTAKETFLNARGDVKKTVSYAYNEKGQVAEVVIESRTKESFAYTYDPNGRVATLSWHQNDAFRGEIAYDYNELGLIATMDSKVQERSGRVAQYHKVVDYTYYPDAQPEQVATTFQ